MESLINRLETILDPKGLVTAALDLDPYLSERRNKFQSKAQLVARPRNTNEVRQIVLACIKEEVSIVPQGGNTGLCGGAVSERDQLVLSLERMNQIRELDPDNSTMTVEAGCILAHLQSAASEAGYFFPLSLAAEGSCQIGGNLATNAGGINVLRYGNARDQVLGLEAVLPNGDVLSELRGLRKNNTGYDLKNLLIGSEGTLGILTAATLKLYPFPDQSATALVALGDLNASLAFLRLAHRAGGGTLCSFELLPKIGLRFAERHVSGCERPMEAEYDWYVLLALQTSGSGIDLKATLQTMLESAFESELIQDAVIASSEVQAQKLWKLREGIVEGQLHEGGSIKHDVSVPVSKVPAFIARACQAVEERIPGIRPCAFGHVGDGNIHFNLSQPTEMDTAVYLSRWDEISALVHDLVESLGGSFSAEHGVGMLKLEDMRRYKDRSALVAMHAIKQALDPHGLFNPGKVLPPL